MAQQTGLSWISDDEKYALLGLSINSDRVGFSDEQLSPELTVLTRTAFKIPTNWREWLGTIRAEEVDHCDLFILSKLHSKRLDVLDDEHQMLQERVWRF